MSLTLQCPACGKPVRVADESAGRRVRCPYCEKPMTVPGPAATTNDDDDWLSLDDRVPPAKTGPQSDAPAANVRSAPTSPPADPDWGVGDQPGDDFFGTAAADATDGTSGDDFFGDLPPIDTAAAAASLRKRLAALDVDAGEPLPATSPATPRPAGKTTGRPGGAPIAAAVETAAEYRIRCPNCDSPTHVKATQAGRTIQCYDCHAPIKVPPPPKIASRPKMDLERAETFALSQPASMHRPADPFVKSAQALLDSAEKEEVEKEPERYDTPDMVAWFKGVFGVYRQPEVIMYTVVLSLIGGGTSFAILSFPFPLLTIGLLVGAVLFAGIVVACAFRIMESNANDEEQINDWPELLAPGDWMGPMALSLAAVGLVSAPAWILGLTMFGPNLVTVFLTMVSICVLFPFVLLSMLDMSSVFSPFSPEVAGSVTRCKESWGGFYFSSALLFVGLFMIYLIASLQTTPVGAAIMVPATIIVTFIYFAMLGRLAFSIGQAVNAPPSEQEEDVEHPRRKQAGQPTRTPTA